MTIIRCEYDGVIYDLDVLEEIPIRLDVSAIENSEIGEVFGASSQKFTLPGSKKNNRFFKHAYKVGSTVIPGLNQSVKAWVISESDTLLEGSLYLDGVLKTQNEGVNYEVTIVNNVITFNETIKTTRVKDLGWNDYSHSLSMINITNSWDNGLFGGDIFYPLVDFGRDGLEPVETLPNIAINPEGTSIPGFINSPLTPIQANQFSPAVRVKTVLDKIFEAGDFTYETSLTDLFNNTYILPRQTETLSVKGSDFSDYGFIASKGGSLVYPTQVIDGDGEYDVIHLEVEEYDPTNSFNTFDYTYTVPRAGSYSFSGSIVYDVSPEDDQPRIRARIVNKTTNTTLASAFGGADELLNNRLDIQTSGLVYLNQNDEIQLEAQYIQGRGEGLLEIEIVSGSYLQTTQTPINWETGIVDMGQQFDPQVKCIDILRGIIQKFNLVFEPDYTKSRRIKIETYDTWVKDGDVKDWTKKIQQAERIFLKSPLSDQPKTIQFQDAKDNDKLSKQVIDNAEGLQWGTAIIDSVSDVPQGEKKIGEYFAPIVLERIPGSSKETNVVPQLYKTDDTQVERKTFKHKPRLGYKVTASFDTDCYIGSNLTPFRNYATISNYDSLPIVSGSTKNLHWNDTFYPPTFTDTTGTITAYDQYWNIYVNQLYNDGNKIIQADIFFEPYELRNLKLNDIIFIEDEYYRINKIKGFNVNQPDVASVELISVAQGELPAVELNCNFDFDINNVTTTTTLIPPVQPTTSTSTTTAPTTTTTSTTTAGVFKNYIGEITSSFNVNGIFMKAVPASTPPGGVTQFAFENETMTAGSASFSGSIPLNYTYTYTNEFGFNTSPNQSEINYEWYYDNVLDSTGSVVSGTGFVIPSSKAEETWSEVKVVVNVTPTTTTTVPPTTTTTSTTTASPNKFVDITVENNTGVTFPSGAANPNDTVVTITNPTIENILRLDGYYSGTNYTSSNELFSGSQEIQSAISFGTTNYGTISWTGSWYGDGILLNEDSMSFTYPNVGGLSFTAGGTIPDIYVSYSVIHELN